MYFFSLNQAIGGRRKRLWLSLSAFESPKIQDYFDQIVFIRNKQGRSYRIICPPKPQKIVFFSLFFKFK